jgi:uncharacterized protein (DUF2249 family)
MHPKTDYVLDARFMEPPEPFVRTLDMLKTLPAGERMLLQLYREPHPLYRILQQDGYRYETELLDDGTFEILIGR